ncbi:hypothetical protein IWW50_003669, partial [Coemansia erecta]
MKFSGLFFVYSWLLAVFVVAKTTPQLTALAPSDIPPHVISSGVLNKTVVFGYTYESGIDASTISWDSLTHIVLAFFKVDPTGNVATSSSSIPAIVSAAHKNNVKVLGSIGGDGDGSAALTKALSTSSTRTHLAASLASIIKNYNLDGIDYDLEFPGSRQELDNLYAGLKSMRASLDSKFGKQSRLLTMTLYSSKGIFGPKLSTTDATPFSDIVDYGLLMSYDYFGSFSEISAPNSPFYDIPGYPGLSFTSSVTAWLKNGWDPKKLVAGLPFYGRTSIVKSAGSLATQFMPNSGDTPPSGPVSRIAGAWTWNDLRNPEGGALQSANTARNGWQRFWDSNTETPWLFHNASSTYLGYDDPESLAIKANYIITQGLVGAMVWMVQYDYDGELQSVTRNYAAACSRISRLANAEQERSMSEESSSDSSSDSSDAESVDSESNDSESSEDGELDGIDSMSSGGQIQTHSFRYAQRMSTTSLILDHDFASGKTCSHDSDLSAKDFMLLGGNGVYTAMRTVSNGRRVFLFDDHLQRLSNSHRQVLGGTYDPQHWRGLLMPLLKRGLSQVRGESKITVLVGRENLRVQFVALHGPGSQSCWVRFVSGHREDPEAKDL